MSSATFDSDGRIATEIAAAPLSLTEEPVARQTWRCGIIVGSPTVIGRRVYVRLSADCCHFAGVSFSDPSGGSKVRRRESRFPAPSKVVAGPRAGECRFRGRRPLASGGRSGGIASLCRVRDDDRPRHNRCPNHRAVLSEISGYTSVLYSQNRDHDTTANGAPVDTAAAE